MDAKHHEDAAGAGVRDDLAAVPVPFLDKVRRQGRGWVELAEQYHVTNPEPPWRTSLDGMCDALAAGQCALPALDRRWEEDTLSQTLYHDVPFPERQLLALAHSLVVRGLISEDELQQKFQIVLRRLSA